MATPRKKTTARKGASKKTGGTRGRAKGIVTPDNPLGLAPRYMALVDAYFDLNFSKQAATLKAGFKNEARGYTWRLFNRPDVKAEIARRQAMNRYKYDIKQDGVDQRMYSVVMQNFGQIMVKLQHNNWDLECLSEEELYCIDAFDTEITLVGRGEDKMAVKKIKIRPLSRLQAAAHLAKTQGWGNDGNDAATQSEIEEILRYRPQLERDADRLEARRKEREQLKKKTSQQSSQAALEEMGDDVE